MDVVQPTDARAAGASPFRPPAEALPGQVLRGGRSWPSERKLGAGAEKSGNEMEERSCGATTDGKVLNRSVIEQKSQQRLHFAGLSE